MVLSDLLLNVRSGRNESGHIGLSATEILRRTYEALCDRRNPSEIILPEKVLVEVAHDPDVGRFNIGYDRIGLFDIYETNWAIVQGSSNKGLLNETYARDIIALNLDEPLIKSSTDVPFEEKTCEQLQEELEERIKNNTYFENTLFLAHKDGFGLFERDYEERRFKGTISLDLIQRFIVRGPIELIEHDHFSHTVRHRSGPTRYESLLVDFLVWDIEGVLRKESYKNT